MFAIDTLSPAWQTRLMVIITLVGWVVLGWQYQPSEIYMGMFPATVASIVGLVLVLLLSGTRLTAILGKIAIFVALLQLFTIYVATLTITIDVNEWWLLYAIISGLVLERVSPHQQFYTWMFLGIATKVQFGLVSGALVQFGDTAGLVPDMTWWVTVVLLALLVPMAATSQRLLYRVVVALGSVLGVVLFVDTAVRFTDLSVAAVVLAGAAIIWPPLIDRWIGHKIFVTKE